MANGLLTTPKYVSSSNVRIPRLDMFQVFIILKVSLFPDSKAVEAASLEGPESMHFTDGNVKQMHGRFVVPVKRIPMEHVCY